MDTFVKYYPLLAFIAKYLLIGLVYLFIYRIARIIYLDVQTVSAGEDAKRLLPHLRAQATTQEMFPITKTITVIGRGAFCDIVLSDHHISSKHALIEKTSTAESHFSFNLKDLGSANGTYLNGERIDESKALRNGDMIGIGPLKFKFFEGGQHYA